MAEPDVFERRLQAALVRHTDGGPTDFDALAFAREVAAKEPRRHGLATALGWRMAGVPRLAWVLLLLAALLAATVGGALFIGSQKAPTLPAVLPPVGQTFACPPGSNPDKPGPVDQARPPESGPMAFDRAAGKIVMLAGAGTWTFDVCSNSWTLMPLASGPATGLALAYDPGADLIIGVEYPEHPVASPPHAWAYSLADNTWTRKGPAPEYVARLWYDAATAQVAAWATASDEKPGTIWTYDVASDTWAAAGALEVLGGYGWGTPHDLLAYDASLDRVVATVTVVVSGTADGGVRTRLVDLHTGSVVDTKAVAPWAGQCGYMSSMFCYDRVAGAAIAYDEHAERTVVLIAGNMFAYDGAADRWDTLYGPGAPGASDTVASANAAAGAMARESWDMVSDPVNGRLVVLGRAGAVLAFDATTRAWAVLLDQGQVQPVPTP